MLKVRAITPIHVADAELNRRADRYRRLAPPGLCVEVVDLGSDAPTQLATAEEVEESDRLMRAAIATVDPVDADVIMPDCVLDPGVPVRPEQHGDHEDQASSVPAVSAPAVPVVGLLRLAAGHLATLGQPFGAVTRNEAIGAELERRLALYGLQRHLVNRRVLDLNFDAIADDHQWNTTLRDALDSLGAEGACAVINGCSAVDVEQSPRGAVAVDPTALALRLLGTGVAAQLWSSQTPASAAAS